MLSHLALCRACEARETGILVRTLRIRLGRHSSTGRCSHLNQFNSDAISIFIVMVDDVNGEHYHDDNEHITIIILMIWQPRGQDLCGGYLVKAKSVK